MTKYDIPISNEIVTGYHGTNIEKAEIILRTQNFEQSVNSYDWLGHGIYFWKNDKQRSWFWADKDWKSDSVVVEVEIKLGKCLSFFSAANYNLIKIAYQKFLKQNTGPLPVNKNKKHELDCTIINYAIEEFAPDVQTVEGFFNEGDPLYTGSSFSIYDSVQLCVRDSECLISDIKISKR